MANFLRFTHCYISLMAYKALISEEWIGTRSTKGKFTFLLNILAVTYSTLLPSPVSTTKCEIYMPCKEKNVLQNFFLF